MSLQNNTVAAISTPLGVGGIGVIRVSGPDAFSVTEAIFAPVSGKKLTIKRATPLITDGCMTATANSTRRWSPSFGRPIATPART